MALNDYEEDPGGDAVDVLIAPWKYPYLPFLQRLGMLSIPYKFIMSEYITSQMLFGANYSTYRGESKMLSFMLLPG